MSAPQVPDLQHIPPEVEDVELTGVQHHDEVPLLHTSESTATAPQIRVDGYAPLAETECPNQVHSEEATLAGSERNSTYDTRSISSRKSVRPWSHRASRKFLLSTGANRFGVTLLFCILIGLTLRAYEGFDDNHPRILSSLEARTFNAIMLGLSLGLGLNLASSLKLYGLLLRWSILTRDYVSVQVFDLVLGCESLTKVFKLMLISMPGVEHLPFLKFFPFFHPRRDGSRFLICLLWLLTNLGAQILVATLSIFWPIDPSNGIALLTTGDVLTSNLTAWQVGGRQTLQMTSANAYGIAGSDYIDTEDENADAISNGNGISIYHGPDFYEYTFLNRNPDNPRGDFVFSARKIRTRAVCEQYTLAGSGVPRSYNGSLWVTGLFDAGDTEESWPIIHVVKGMLSWTALVQPTCGPRCTTLIVYQRADGKAIATNSMFKCNSTVEPVPNQDHAEFVNLKDADKEPVYTSDNFARLAAGAIAWTGYTEDKLWDLQCRVYMSGLRFTPDRIVNTTDVENILARFSVGAIAAFDESGPQYTIEDQRIRPVQGQRLNPQWPSILIVLIWIIILQFSALMALLACANKSIIRDDSFLSVAMLLRGVVEKIPKAEGMNLSGEQIFTHPNLWGERIKYDYTKERIEDEKEIRKVKKVAVRFENQNDPNRCKKKRRNWADGDYI